MSKHVIAQAHDRIGSTMPVCKQPVAVRASHVIASMECAAGHPRLTRRGSIHLLLALVLTFFFVGCDDSSSASARSNDEPSVESSSSVKRDLSSSDGKVTERLSSLGGDAEVNSSSLGEQFESGNSSVDKVNCSVFLEGETRWSWDVPKECRFNPDIDYGTMTDIRDGKVYKTVKIGLQIWMAENLNYADSVKTPSLKGKSWCYDNDEKKCDVTGRLYTWGAAMDSAKTGYGYNFSDSLVMPVQGICPAGWHLPSFEEWNTLLAAVGGKSTAGNVLKSQTGWNKGGNGIDAFGFSVLPAGEYGGYFHGEGFFATFWSSTDSNRVRSYPLNFYYNYEYAYIHSFYMEEGFSVRCLRDDSKGDASHEMVEFSGSFNLDIDYGSMTDSRDGKTYKTVVIGSQTWMAENLNYADSTKTPSLKGSSWCFNNNTANCEVAGRLYSWAAAMDSAVTGCGYGLRCALTLPVQGVCPSGWHLPSFDEWKILFDTVGGETVAGDILKSQKDWHSDNGPDSFGFSALPAGSYGLGYFHEDGYATHFWIPDEFNDDWALNIYLARSGKSSLGNPSNKDYGYSVRCIKDEL
jgi:uncharacterized protein (TIGR02145 family)